MCKHRRKPLNYFHALAMLLLALPAGRLAAETGQAEAVGRPVTVIVQNNRSPGAILYLAVYAADSEEANWQQEHHQALKLVLPPEEEARVELELADGRYAMRAFADVNGNGELDTQRFNRPAEPFAISMAPGRDKPSMRFGSAVVGIDEANQTVRLKLIYPEDLVESSGESANSD